MLATKLQTSSTVQLEISSCNLGLSESALLETFVPVGLLDDGVFVLGLFTGGAAEDKSSGDDVSCRLAFFRRFCSSASLAVLTIASRVCVVDMSISGWNMGAVEKELRMDEKSCFLAASSLDGVDMFGKVGKVVDLNLGSKGGGKPFRATLK